MTTQEPLRMHPAARPRDLRRPLRPVPPGAWRYHTQTRSRFVIVCATLVSAGLHVGILFGVGPVKKKPMAPAPDYTIGITVDFQELKELDDPEPVVNDEPGEKPDLGVLVPMLADVPQIAQAADFVQQVDFASLVEQPDLSRSNLATIPDHISRGGKIGDGLGAVFNLSELDRAPTAVFQPPPLPPRGLEKDFETQNVRVEFIVTADGRVVNVFATSSSDPRFDSAAVTGVSKWKFKPGIKAGRKVNTRMAVPIIFHGRA